MLTYIRQIWRLTKFEIYEKHLSKKKILLHLFDNLPKAENKFQLLLSVWRVTDIIGISKLIL